MRKKTSKTLRLNRETVRLLAEDSLKDAVGGTSTNCPGDITYGILCTLVGCGPIDP